jgi:hypothetical protein
MPKPTPLKPYKPIIKALLALDKIGKAKQRYLTFSGRTDGIGTQVHAVFSLHAYAFLRNMTYLHSPIKNIGHGCGSATWDKDWNEFFNLSIHEPAGLELPLRDLNIKKQWFLKNGVIYRSLKAHPITDLFPETYLAVIPSLRKAYDDSSFNKEDVYGTKNCLKIAVHVRRGDAANHLQRASNLDSVKLKISSLQETLKNTKTPYEIHVFSQGELADFKLLEDLEVHFHLDTDLFVTFHSLVTADILLMARSSLSYSAALLSKGAIVYEKFWHPKLKHWHSDISDLEI